MFVPPTTIAVLKESKDMLKAVTWKDNVQQFKYKDNI